MIKARGQFHQIKNEDTGASSTDLQDYTDHTVVVLEIDELTQPVNIYGSFSCARRKATIYIYQIIIAIIVKVVVIAVLYAVVKAAILAVQTRLRIFITHYNIIVGYSVMKHVVPLLS